MQRTVFFVLFAHTLILNTSLCLEVKNPTILISILVRNKAHTLPYFLSLLENHNYPKERISLWIRSDHNVDNSIEILQKWIKSVESQYHSIDTKFLTNENSYADEIGIAHWPASRFNHIIELRESVLHHGRYIWADYLLAIDVDAFLINPNTLQNLISKNLTLVAPLLKSDSLYSNFWHAMTADYYYERSEDYKPVLNRERKGCFQVPMIHSCVLIDLRKKESEFLTYVPDKIENYEGPKDDIISFAISARNNKVDMHICNDDIYGFIMVPLEQDDQISLDLMQLTNLKLEILNENEPLFVNDLLKEFTSFPEKNKLGFDQVFMINLLRRPERRVRMLQCFDELGLEAEVFDAVDGRALDKSFLNDITFLPEYQDPFHKRPMTLGEIGCFMSHYNIWQEIVGKQYESSLILEDDIRFEPFFRLRVQNLMDEVQRLGEWDLIYFGRKRMEENEEPLLQGAKYLVEVGYSYWTLGYAISLKGAQKLLDANPLDRLLPVDEYLPILFDKHPQSVWKEHFPERNLIALSAAPLLVYPTHYTGENGYISDTEDSVIIKDPIQPKEDL